jgi:hypothetical protein
MIKSLITFANMLLDTAWALIFILLSSLVFYLIGIGHKLKINKPKKKPPYAKLWWFTDRFSYLTPAS